jgi:hypothetical protein
MNLFSFLLEVKSLLQAYSDFGRYQNRPKSPEKRVGFQSFAAWHGIFLFQTMHRDEPETIRQEVSVYPPLQKTTDLSVDEWAVFSE